MPLMRLIYVSEPQFDPREGSPLAQLGAIMSASIRNNEAAGITGALAYDASWFLQVLEGERAAVWKTFSRIAEDERHVNCTPVEMVEIEDRCFGKWWMGLATRNASTAPIFRPYLVNGTLQAAEMSAAGVLDLMAALSRLGLHRGMSDTGTETLRVA